MSAIFVFLLILILEAVMNTCFCASFGRTLQFCPDGGLLCVLFEWYLESSGEFSDDSTPWCCSQWAKQDSCIIWHYVARKPGRDHGQPLSELARRMVLLQQLMISDRTKGAWNTVVQKHGLICQNPGWYGKILGDMPNVKNWYVRRLFSNTRVAHLPL